MGTQSRAVSGVGHDRGGCLRVLVAEDDLANRVLLKHALEGFHCEVVVVADGLQAVQEICTGKFDVAILDFHMPGLDGVEATKRIRAWERSENRRRLPVIACTASAMNHERQACLDAHMDAVLTKPFRLDELERLVVKWGGGAPP